MMNFGQAIEALKEGKRVARNGWNGKGMYLYLVKGQKLWRSNLVREAYEHAPATGEKIQINSHIDMKAADGSITVGWTASQIDMLAEDWDIVD